MTERPLLRMTPSELFDELSRSLNPAIFSDPDIYQRELETVFARSWLFVAHESHLAKPGDFVASYMAEDPVIVCRQRDGSIRVMLNQCRHRSMKVCRVEAGNAKAFTCSYHGWAYGTNGDLVNVPMEERGYQDLSKSSWGLRQARVETYKGLIFATWNDIAEDLVSYLGDITYHLDTIVDSSSGGTEALGGIAKWVIPCNWKLAAEQFASDMYHAFHAHLSPGMALSVPGEKSADWRSLAGYQYVSDRNGHGTGFFAQPSPAIEWAWRQRNSVETVDGFDPSRAFVRNGAHLGDERSGVFHQHLTIFPNFSVFNSARTLRVWHPRGPNEIEVWAFGIVDSDAPAEEREQVRVATTRTFSPAGTFEQDDGDNWVEIQKVLRGFIARNTPLNIQMDGKLDPEQPAFKRTHAHAFSESAARGFYRHWVGMVTNTEASTSDAEKRT